MSALQIAIFRLRHRFVKSRNGVRCMCGWRPAADVPACDVARAALAHLSAEKALIEGRVA